jgi:hypothetical protein
VFQVFLFLLHRRFQTLALTLISAIHKRVTKESTRLIDTATSGNSAFVAEMLNTRHILSRPLGFAILCGCFVALPQFGRAQFDFTTNNGSLTLSAYTSFGLVAVIPASTNNLPVTAIGDLAFAEADVASVSIPAGVTNIGTDVFRHCASLTNVTFQSGVRSISGSAFMGCSSLQQIALPDTLTTLGSFVFYGCSNLTTASLGNGLALIPSGALEYCVNLTNVNVGNNVTSISASFIGCSSLSTITLPASLTNLTTQAFASCSNLTSVYFQGNAPNYGVNVFTNDNNATVHYVPGTSGWGSTYAGRPAALWYLPNPRILGGPTFGIHTNAFTFTISWATNIPVIVEASASLISPSWSPVSTNTLVNGASSFSDARWTNSAARFYRLRSP